MNELIDENELFRIQQGQELRDLGIILFEQKDYTNALLKFEDALKFSPNDVKAKFYRGLCHCLLTPSENSEKIEIAILEIKQAFQRQEMHLQMLLDRIAAIELGI